MLKFSKSRRDFSFTKASDVQTRAKLLVKSCSFTWIKKERIFCIRSKGSKTRAFARIWGLARVWQEALGLEPAYILEVISERFDKLPQTQKDRILLHELAHIPKSFSGALVSHRRKGGVTDEVVDRLFAQLSQKR